MGMPLRLTFKTTGTRDEKNFTVDELLFLGGGIAVQYGSAWAARQMTAGLPVPVRFTGECVCDAQKQVPFPGDQGPYWGPDG